MIFSSILFLFYFLPAFLIIYHLMPHKYKNYWALAASIFFYAWGAPKFVFVVAGVIIADFFIVNKIYSSENQKLRKQLLALSVFIKLGLLAYFKYANFFVENIDWLLLKFGFSEMSWTKVALPIGISFFTFQALTYSVDVYRKVHAPLKSVADYLLYILLFPQLIAGPIVRFNEIADQLEDRKHLETYENKVLGFFRFVIGLAKKVLIANVLAVEADHAFALQATELSSNVAWIGILAYTFQIYFDFSGYSDMAIGLGRMMGFKFPENFDNPYISQNITEFWRRWHMTLGRFMKDYLYIPLGGNKVGIKRMYFNLAFVFVVSGFWHGAAWNFIIWGAFHGAFLIMDRLFLLNFYKAIGKYPSILITFFITIIGWVIFRATSFEQIKYYIKALFSFNNTEYYLNKEFYTIGVFAIFFAFLTATNFGKKVQDFFFFRGTYSSAQLMIYFIVVVLLFTLSVSSLAASGFNPFIYFRF
ncbi:MAG: MBOAT family protein [Bacteroidales bacterium]|nr:MBOAT family protein [Bacteroidales bacterium]